MYLILEQLLESSPDRGGDMRASGDLVTLSDGD